MSIESVAGKNPVTHVGKLYNLAATRIANRLVRDGAAITGASSVLVSQIGHPVEDPQLVDLRLELKHGFSIGNMRTRVEEAVAHELQQFSELQADLLAGRVRVY